MFLAGLPIKLCTLMIDLTNQLFFIEEKILFINLLQRFLMKIGIVDW